MTRRSFLGSSLAAAQTAGAQIPWTKFQLAGMTLPYSAFPLERALEGIHRAGYAHVALGTTHSTSGRERVPVLAPDAPASNARDLGRRCRDLGLDPVMMFSMVNLEAADSLDVHLRRIEQAAAAGIPFLLTFGKTSPGEYDAVIRNLKAMGPRAREAKVLVVIKQHGGNSATGKDCARILAETGDEGIKICYDAGNVLDYQNDDPIADIQTCWKDIRAFCIKDHRNTPKDQDCGPGFGEIDHYKLFTPVMRTGLTMPLAFENIFEPLVARPRSAEAIDILARRAKEYIETVIRGLQSV